MVVAIGLGLCLVVPQGRLILVWVVATVDGWDGLGVTVIIVLLQQKLRNLGAAFDYCQL